VAKPRVFVSSTFYDLKHVRAELSEFIKSLGFEPVLHERGNVPYLPGTELDESCRVEVQNADIVVLIIGGRYGSPTSASLEGNSAPAIYDSVTRSEFRTAADRGFPMWIMIEKSVLNDWENFNRNRSNSGFRYAHTDDPQVFAFIDEIQSFRNKSTHTFEYGKDITEWLREQWSGVFGKLIRDSANQRQLGKIEAQVGRLEAVVKVLTEQLDFLMANLAGHNDVERIRKARSELTDKHKITEKLHENPAVQALLSQSGLSFDEIVSRLASSEDVEAAVSAFRSSLPPSAESLESFKQFLLEALAWAKQARADSGSPN